jgi:hypothetical protein
MSCVSRREKVYVSSTGIKSQTGCRTGSWCAGGGVGNKVKNIEQVINEKSKRDKKRKRARSDDDSSSSSSDDESSKSPKKKVHF